MITRKEWTIVPKCMTEMIDMSNFEKAWKVAKEDEAEKWAREYDEAYSRGDQETMDRMNADNEKMERYQSDYEAHADEVDPLPPDQRIVDMANEAHGWGTMLAYQDHHESIFEELTSDLPPIYGPHVLRMKHHPYWEAKEQAEELHDKIWQAGLAALGLKPSKWDRDIQRIQLPDE